MSMMLSGLCWPLPQERATTNDFFSKASLKAEREVAASAQLAALEPVAPNASYFHADNKYKMVARMLGEASGPLLDIGARDQILKQYLPAAAQAEYHAADASDGCEFKLDLEKPLQFTDGQFETVVALDVLEHVETMHVAFAELVRITQKRLIIALPSISTLRRRLSFLFQANLATTKYDLYPFHQGDRHRWLTTYDQIKYFYGMMAAQHGLTWEISAEELEHAFIGSYVGTGLNRLALPGRQLFIDRLTACFTKA